MASCSMRRGNRGAYWAARANKCAAGLGLVLAVVEADTRATSAPGLGEHNS